MTTAPIASVHHWAPRLGLLAALLVALLAAPAGAVQSDRAAVRIIHAVAGAGPIDVYLDGALAVIGTTFPSATDPIELAAGEHRVTVTPTGAALDTALVDSTITVDAGANVDIALIGSAEAIEARSFPVDQSQIAPDLARLRVINASPDAGPLTPTITGGSDLFPTVDFLLATEYADLPAGAYALDLLGTDSGAAVVSLPDLELAAGDVVDVYIVGLVANETAQALVVRARAGIATPVGRPAVLRAGACAEPGATVADLGVIAAPDGTPVGRSGVAAVENGFTAAPMAFDDLLAADHVVTVATSDEAGAPLLACGEIGGRLTDDGALAIALRATDGTLAGMAVLAPSVLDAEATDVSIFLAPANETAVPAAATPVSDAG
ncbi:MAG: DUF4397 domain-containing protein [Thermomicrobiales bacterium]|nr:DUF4397 domain-containing protein [Thermomicrobiales bacterium]